MTHLSKTIICSLDTASIVVAGRSGCGDNGSLEMELAELMEEESTNEDRNSASECSNDDAEPCKSLHGSKSALEGSSAGHSEEGSNDGEEE